MKSQFNKTWLLIIIAIIGNIIIFSILSNKLEDFVVQNITNSNTVKGI